MKARLFPRRTLPLPSLPTWKQGSREQGEWIFIFFLSEAILSVKLLNFALLFVSLSEGLCSHWQLAVFDFRINLKEFSSVQKRFLNVISIPCNFMAAKNNKKKFKEEVSVFQG